MRLSPAVILSWAPKKPRTPSLLSSSTFSFVRPTLPCLISSSCHHIIYLCLSTACKVFSNISKPLQFALRPWSSHTSRPTMQSYITPPYASIWTQSYYQTSAEPPLWPPTVSLICYICLLYNQIPGFTICPIYPPGYPRSHIQPLIYQNCPLLSRNFNYK